VPQLLPILGGSGLVLVLVLLLGVQVWGFIGIRGAAQPAPLSARMLRWREEEPDRLSA
jgi:hypothetical protein